MSGTPNLTDEKDSYQEVMSALSDYPCEIVDSSIFARFNKSLLPDLRQAALRKKNPLMIRQSALRVIAEFVEQDSTLLPFMIDNFVQGVNEKELQKLIDCGEDSAYEKFALYSLACEILSKHGYKDIEKLVECVIDGKVKEVREILEGGTNPNWASSQGLALMRAITNNQQDIALLLLEYGANPEAVEIDIHPTGNTQLTALMRASIEIAPKVVAALIDAGANPDRVLGDKMTAMMWAARTMSGHATIKVLLDKGADPKVKHPDGSDARSIALSFDREKTIALLDSIED